MRSNRICYWITPVGTDEVRPGEEVVSSQVGDKKFYGLGRRTPGRRSLKPGDWVCFYVSKRGVVAHARVVSRPEMRPDLSPFFPMVFYVDSVRLYLSEPVGVDEMLRLRLEAFNKTNPRRAWGWFVTSTHRITRHDFGLLTDPHFRRKTIALDSPRRRPVSC
jgi:hypothetical protein